MASPAEDLIVKTFNRTHPFKRYEIRCAVVAERVGYTYEAVDEIVQAAQGAERAPADV